ELLNSASSGVRLAASGAAAISGEAAGAAAAIGQIGRGTAGAATGLSSMMRGAREGGAPRSQIDRKAFAKDREAFWKNEAKNNPEGYSAENLERMKQGRAPIGSDGKPM